MNIEEDKFSKLFCYCKQELYPSCENFSKLSFTVQLLNIKCLFDLSDKATYALLSLLAKAFPHGNKVPMSYYEARKFTRELGLDYVKIDACLNDCIIYRGDYLESTCPTCTTSCRVLSHDHSWRNNAKAFDDNKEKQSTSKPLSGMI